MNKELMYEKYDTEFNLRLADEVGLDIGDLLKSDYEIISYESNDDLTYGFRIEFKESSPIDILRKVFGDDTQNRHIELDINLFND